MAKRTRKSKAASQVQTRAQIQTRTQLQGQVQGKAEAATAKTPGDRPEAAEAKTSRREARQADRDHLRRRDGARQREISVSEFFTKNRHLLGFDNPRKRSSPASKKLSTMRWTRPRRPASCLTSWSTWKSRWPTWRPTASEPATRFRVTVTTTARDSPPADSADLREAPLRLEVPQAQNGPGPAGHRHLGGRHVRSADDGQAGADHLAHRRAAAAHYFEVQIDTKKNEPRIVENKKIDWEHQRGTQVALEIDGRYQKGRASVDEYLEQVAIANPHVQLVYRTPEGETREYPRTIQELPPQPKEIKPHPYGIEFAFSLRMLHDTRSHTLAGFSPPISAGCPPPWPNRFAERPSCRRTRKPRNVHGGRRRGGLQGNPVHQDHGTASNCISPIGARRRSSTASTSRSRVTSTRR